MLNYENFVSKDDIEKAIEAVNFNKGIGPDGFNGHVLKDDNIKQNLVTFIIDCFNKGNFPEYLKEGRLVLFTKNGLEISEIENTRPIVVLSHITKIIEKVILNKLKDSNSKMFDVGEY